jgi:hypothetical protein
MRNAAASGRASQAGTTLMRAYSQAATASSIQPVPRAHQKLLSGCIGFIVALVFLPLTVLAVEAPPGLARKIAHRESETAAERSHYAFRQSVRVTEMTARGANAGEYREVREVVFSPEHERSEKFIGQPMNTLKNLRMTDEDFADVRNIQPFVLTEQLLPLYETKFRGDEKVNDIDCWVLQVRPRQILQNQRLFDGLLWANKDDYSIVKSEGQAVPQVITSKSENLFPRFTTLRHPVREGWWFPVETYGDDTLPFRTGPLRIRLIIRFSGYQKFGADTSITFEK